MLFYSNSRLIFQIVLNGQYRLVEFSEAGANSRCSTFRTREKSVIDAIRRHKFFRQGKIREENDEPPVKEVEKKKPEVILEFASYSQLKSYLRKNFKGDPKAAKLKTPQDAAKFAKENGVEYRFVEA